MREQIRATVLDDRVQLLGRQSELPVNVHPLDRIEFGFGQISIGQHGQRHNARGGLGAVVRVRSHNTGSEVWCFTCSEAVVAVLVFSWAFADALSASVACALAIACSLRR